MNNIDDSGKGQNLVEFALILPALLLLLFGVVEFGLIILSFNTLANTGREIARYGSIHPDKALINQYITDNVYGSDRRWGFGMDPTRLDIQTSLSDKGLLVSTVHVTATYSYTFMTGPLVSIFTDPVLPLRSTATMYTESVPVVP